MRLVQSLTIILLLGSALLVMAQTDEPAPTDETVVELEVTRLPDTAAQIFTFEAEQAGNVRLNVTSDDGLTMALVLTDANGTFVAEAGDPQGTGVTVLETTLPSGGLYYVTVLPMDRTESLLDGTYFLTVEAIEAAETVETTAEATGTATVDVPATTVTVNGMQVTLTWDSTANLDLEVRDPVGGTVYFNSPVADFGATFGNNVNGACEALVAEGATEQVTWTPGGVPVGSYEILVYYQDECENNGPVDFTINAIVDGETLDSVEGTLLPQQIYVASFQLEEDGSARMSERSGVRGEEQLPASAAILVRNAEPIELGAQVTGTITNEQPYQSYTFNAPANTLVSITMNATSGSLDPYVALIDPTGNVVYFNDDAAPGVTDAALRNSLLAIAGNYTVVASRYALTIGGTEGDYVLTVSAGGTTPGAETTADATGAPQAEDVPASVTSLALPEGSIEVTLIWDTLADIQLLVRDPAGDAVYDDVPSIRSGGRLGADGNVNCTEPDTSPVSYIYWPTNITPRAGAYEIDVWFQNDCGDSAPVNFTLYVSVGGEPILTQRMDPSRPFLPNEHFISSFTIGADGTVTAGEGGIAGIESLDWQSEAANALPITVGDVVSGSISATNKFDLYAFDALAGDVVTISMNAAGGVNLDPKVYLIGPNGTVVAQNDDAVPGENRNSLISNFTLPEDGQYIIIATHYGDRYGVTSGAYNLSLD
ncbi:MAG: pre-peptidase C-terminal domain-containing protein [Chloroflexota bacterium]